MFSEIGWILPAPREPAITAAAVPARCSWTAWMFTLAPSWRWRLKEKTSPPSKALEGGSPSPFAEELSLSYAAQCGWCTPGMILSAKALLDRNPNPTKRKCGWPCPACCAAALDIRPLSKQCSMPRSHERETVSAELLTVRQSVPPIYGIEKATGALRFPADINLPNMLWMKILRSPHAHARIVAVDATAAEKISGVAAVITHKDVPRVSRPVSK